MKLSFVMILASVLQVSANANGQSTVTLKGDKVEIYRLLNNIERQGTYRFLYNSRLQELHEKVSINVTDKPISETLQLMFTGSELTFKMLENNLIVVLSAASKNKDMMVTGKITGENGEALPNVSVTVKGTAKGTTTDNNGNFTISAPETAVLVVSYVGYKGKEVPVGSQSVVNISIEKSVIFMDQVVVVGYGTQRKVDVTGSVATVSGAELTKQPIINAVSGLQGKVAGVQITNTGTPGSSPQIRIRGLGTYYASANPLYVVDGVWFDNVDFLNPADIESVNILKDASSEAIYGIKGANGVVLISTKKGTRNGRPVVNYTGFAGWQVATNQPKMSDAHEYSILFNELGKISNSTTFLDSSKYGTGTNWFDQALRNAFITNHQVSVAGGGEKSTYNFSVGYLDQQGILKTNDYKRYTAKLQNDIIISSHVKTGFTGIGTFANSVDAPGNIWQQIYNASPVVPVYFAGGSYGDPGYYGLGQSVANPQVSLDYNHASTANYTFIGNAYIDISFMRHFTFHSSLGGEYAEGQGRTYTPHYKATSTQQNAVSQLAATRIETRNWIFENTLTYSNTIKDHRFTVLLGQNAQYNNYNEWHATASNVPNNNTGNWYLGLGSGLGSVTDVDLSYNQGYPLLSTIASYFGRINYAFKDRYLINATIRADGSSKFLGSNRWGYFPSVGAAWVISKENFMANQTIFNNLKVKGSWGKVGNVGVPTFASSQQSVSGGAYSVIYGNSGTISPGVSVASILPPPLQWEVGIGTDVGIEASFLNNRLTFEADYYNRETQRIIMNVYLSGSTGLSNAFITTNVGNLQNRGYEFTASWKDDASKDFSYRVNGNFSVNNNKFLSSNAGTQHIPDGGGASTGGQLATLTTIGQPIGVFYGYKVIGIFQTAADVAGYTDAKGNIFQPNAQPGDFKYQSVIGIGPISDNDRQVLGNPNPKYSYGLNTNFTYKAFDLTVDFQGVAGVQIYNAVKGLRYGAENWTEDFYKNRWYGAGTSNKYPSVNIGGGDNYRPNSWYVEDGSYFRIRNLQLGYSLPAPLVTRWGMSRFRIFANAQNPFNFFKYKGFTPEVGGSPGNAGIDNNTYPLYATYNFGVNLSF